MRTLKNYLFFAITLLGLVSFSSCDSEEKMEEHILEGHCWEGYLPIYNWDRTEYYSVFSLNRTETAWRRFTFTTLYTMIFIMKETIFSLGDGETMTMQYFN